MRKISNQQLRPHPVDQIMTPTVNAYPAIALVSYDSLGDSLIYIMISENLRANGFNVTIFGNIAHELRSWIPQIKTQPLPAIDDLDEALATFTFTLMSPPAALRSKLTPEFCRIAREKWALICQKAPDEWAFDHYQRLSRQLSKDELDSLRGLPNCSGPIRFKDFSQESVVDITLEFMREKMQLDTLVRNVPLSPPEGIEKGRHPRRVVVSPDSAGPSKKEWSPGAFLKLCKLLRLNDFDPKIVVSPQNHARWTMLAEGEFEVPLFPQISDLAAFIYESGALIANDSGNGHLASFLGVPVITIYRKRNRYFHWRPDWGPAKVICPSFRLPWPGEDAIWRPFIGKKRILEALKTLQSITKTQNDNAV